MPSWRAWRARRAGRSCASSASGCACGWTPGRRRWPARWGSEGACAVSLHELSDEQRAIRDLARRFADERIAPEAAERDRGHTLPRELSSELGELGLLGVRVPAEHG